MYVLVNAPPLAETPCAQKRRHKKYIFLLHPFYGFRPPKALIGLDVHMSVNESQYNYFAWSEPRSNLHITIGAIFKVHSP